MIRNSKLPSIKFFSCLVAVSIIIAGGSYILLEDQSLHTKNISFADSDVKKTKSSKLGIDFDYVSSLGNQKIKTKEINNRVYIYSESAKRKKDPTKGKFVEVFSKSPNESLSDAIKKQFLKDYSSENCLVTPAKIASKGKAVSSREYVQITTPVVSGASFSQNIKAAKLCPPTYTYDRTGLVYFMMDPDYPDKFVFFSIGQDNFWGESSTDGKNAKTWDQTLKFVK